MGDGGESGGVNGVEMSCRMMGHYFWHYSSEPLVSGSAASLQSRAFSRVFKQRESEG